MHTAKMLISPNLGQIFSSVLGSVDNHRKEHDKKQATYLFQHPLRDFRGDLVRHPDLDRRPRNLPPAEDQGGAGGGRVEDAQQDGLLQVQLINAK